jgi:hypothetical protein
MLINDIRGKHMKELEENSKLPAGAKYDFDLSSISYDRELSNLPLQKTMKRTVISLNFSKFQAREIVREEKKKDKILVHRSDELAIIVPSGARYAYDLIAFVGENFFLKRRNLTDIYQEIKSKRQFPNIPYRSLYDLKLKFLFYFGKLHLQSAPLLREYFRERGNITWLIDGTLEPGTPVFFGVKEALDDIFLWSWKIPTENDKDISASLKKCVKLFGSPDYVLRDLSERMRDGCESALCGVPQKVCHYHFAAAVGKELYKDPQEELSKRLRAIKLRIYLRDQRGRQTQYLKKSIEKNNISLVLKDLLEGKAIDVKCLKTFASEVLLALHLWMLDYPKDSNRQGYPFDPFLLYLHRRIRKAFEASNRLLSIDTVREKNIRLLTNFSNQLDKYLTDPTIIEASSLYEKACLVFERIRDVLRLISKEPNPMHGSYKLNPGEQRKIKSTLDELEFEFGENSKNCTNPKEKSFYEIALNYINKYLLYLIPNSPSSMTEEMLVRTTTAIEKHWGEGKRILREVQGCKKITRSFKAQPEEFMLVPNLKNPKYIELILGTMDNLPKKLAEAGKNAGTFNNWLKRRNPINTGRLPSHLLCDENFIDNLIGIFDAKLYSNN